MVYHEILDNAIKKSKISMRTLCRLSAAKGVPISQGYLSQLCRGEVPPASDKINLSLGNILAEITDVNAEEILVAAYRERIPPEILKKLLNTIPNEIGP